MGMTSEIPVGEPFELADQTVGLERETGRAVFVARTSGRPPNRIEGYTVQSSALGGPPPHGSEMHPDADELLYLLSGRVRVRLAGVLMPFVDQAQMLTDRFRTTEPTIWGSDHVNH
jgi:hypothetical protein